MEVPGPHISGEQISAISNEGTLRLHDVQGFAQRGGVPAVLQGLILGACGKIHLIADRLQAHKTPEVVLVGGEQGEDRGVLPAPVCAEAEQAGYLNNGMKERVNQGRPAKRAGGLAADWWRVMDYLSGIRNMSSVISCLPVQYRSH